MSWFLDASAVIAILARESDWEAISARADEEAELLWAPLSRWESVIGFARQQDIPVVAAREIVLRFGQANFVSLVEMDETVADLAIDACIRYGRRSGHPAKLNMGDCFAYACAKANNARLLYKGDDFAKTDLA